MSEVIWNAVQSNIINPANEAGLNSFEKTMRKAMDRWKLPRMKDMASDDLIGLTKLVCEVNFFFLDRIEKIHEIDTSKHYSRWADPDWFIELDNLYSRYRGDPSSDFNLYFHPDAFDTIVLCTAMKFEQLAQSRKRNAENKES